MAVERYDSVRAAEERLRAAEGGGSASQTFHVLRAVERSFWRCLAHTALRHPRFAASCALARRRPFRVYAACDERGVVLCAPLHCGADGEWTVIAGDTVELDYSDFLYAARGWPELAEAFDAVMRRMAGDGIRHITWKYLEEDGVTASLLGRLPHRTTATFPNVRISFVGGADRYFRSLGRNARSNARREANRVRRDGCHVSFSFRSTVGLGGRMDDRGARALLRRCRAVYLARQESRYGNRGWLARLFFRHGSYVPLSIPGGRSFMAVLEMDGCVAAYMEGYVNPGRQALEVPRIAMDGAFGRYGPGRMLVAETVRWLCANSPIRAIDLCRGDERYKLDLGGIRHATVSVRAATEVSA